MNESTSSFEENEQAPPTEEAAVLKNSARRKFMKGVGAASLAAVIPGALVGGLYGERILGETLNRGAVERALQESRNRLRHEFGIEVDFSGAHPQEKEGEIEGDTIATLVEKRDICDAIAAELSMYPPVIYKKEARISVIRVMDNISYHGMRTVAGLADTSTGVLFLEHTDSARKSADPLSPLVNKIEAELEAFSSGKENLRFLLGHELFHHIDDVDDDDWSLQTRGWKPGDPPGPAHYHDFYNYELDWALKEKMISQELVSRLKKNYAGFARQYGKKNPREDRATISEALFKGAEALSERIKKDETLAKKVKFEKDFFFRKSRGVMNDQYWEWVKKSKGGSKLPAEFQRLQSKHLASLSDEDLRVYVEKYTGERLDNETLKSWRNDILLGVA